MHLQTRRLQNFEFVPLARLRLLRTIESQDVFGSWGFGGEEGPEVLTLGLFRQLPSPQGLYELEPELAQITMDIGFSIGRAGHRPRVNCTSIRNSKYGVI